MSDQTKLLPRAFRRLRYGNRVVALGEQVVTLRNQLAQLKPGLEGSPEAIEFKNKADALKVLVLTFPQFAKLQHYLRAVHDIDVESNLVPIHFPAHNTEPPVPALCPVCGKQSEVINASRSLCDGVTAEGEIAAWIGQQGRCRECGSLLSRSMETLPTHEKEWSPWEKEHSTRSEDLEYFKRRDARTQK
jgi:hypothetical protein